MDSSVVGYDGARNVEDEESSVWQMKPERKQKEETKQSRWGFRGMTVRDWLELLIVPMVLVGIGLLFEMQQADRQAATEKQQQELAEQRAQDEALQAYLNQMSHLLLEKDLRVSGADSEVHTLARARTLTILARLDNTHQRSVVQFLIESTLIQESKGREPVVSLAGANLRGVGFGDFGGETYLRGADLSHADLHGVIITFADLDDAVLNSTNLSGSHLEAAKLSNANLYDANLSNAFLEGAKLSNAFLEGANLRSTYLSRASLSGAHLRSADLSGANLSYTDLSDAVLEDANLRSIDLYGADLHGADLSDAKGLTNKALEEQAKSLDGVTMPNGRKYEDWLKSKGSKEDG